MLCGITSFGQIIGGHGSPCGSGCWQATIQNDLNCDLELHSDYLWGPNCPSINGGIWKTITVSPGQTAIYNPVKRVVGCNPAIFTCDPPTCLDCRCPLWMKIKDWNAPGFVPWAYVNPNWAGLPYPPLPPTPPGASFLDCNGDPVYVHITPNGTNSVLMIFNYTP